MAAATVTAAPVSAGQAILDRLTRNLGARFELIGVSLIINLLGLALPIALLHAYDRVIPYRVRETLVMLVLVVVAAVALETVLRLARALTAARLSGGLEHRLGMAAIRHLFRSDLAQLEAAGGGALFERLNGVKAVRDRLSGEVGVIASDLVFVPFYLVLLVHLGGRLVLVPTAVLVLLALGGPIAARSLRAALGRHAADEDRRSAFLISAIESIRGAKCIAAEARLEEYGRRLDDARARSAMLAEQRSGVAGDLATTLVQAGIAATIAVGAAKVVAGALSPGALAACILLSARALQPAEKAFALWPRSQGAATAAQRLAGLFDLAVAPAAVGGTAGERKADAPARIRGAVTLRNVAVGLDDGAGPVLDGVDMSIRPGELVAIVGPNGCGKTMLLSVIAGLARPSAGEVLIDDRPLDRHDPATIRQAIAYLPQRETLFRGTIMDNLTMFRPHYERRAQAAAAFIGLADEVRAMPRGFRTPVGDGAVRAVTRSLALRIAIARALVDRPRILLFDEPNTALDHAADERLKVALAALRGHCTVIIVSYRPSILRLADRIHDVRAGRLDRGGLTLRSPAP